MGSRLSARVSSADRLRAHVGSLRHMGLAPKTQFVRGGDGHLAYQVFGDGPAHLLYGVPLFLRTVGCTPAVKLRRWSSNRAVTGRRDDTGVLSAAESIRSE